jgi:enoyl-CoA hydratase/carnithine racemase
VAVTIGVNMKAEYECLLYEEADGVATIALNRPEKLNALNPKLGEELGEVWRGLRMNDDVRVAVLTGAGDRAFSSGIDLTYEYPQPTSKFMINDDIRFIGPKSNDLWKPVIAAVNGIACGAAFFLLGECEMIIAADSATFFDPHLSHGMPAVAEPMFMYHLMPFGEIARMSLLSRAERMTAARALAIGLVQELVSRSELMEAARWAATVIAQHPDATAVEATVKAIWTAQSMSRDQALSVAPQLIQLTQTDRAMAERADELRQRAIEPRLR